LLLNETEGLEIGTQRAVLLSKLKETVFAVIGLGGLDVEYLLLHLILKEMVIIHRNEFAQEYVIIKSVDVLQLYMNYLRTKMRNGSLIGENFSDKTFELIGTIIETGERSGRKEGERLIRIGLPQVELELERSGKGKHIDLDALEQLEAAKLVICQADSTQTTHGIHKRSILIYNVETIKRVYQLRIWLPIFKEEIND
jgi:hypothetical protein